VKQLKIKPSENFGWDVVDLDTEFTENFRTKNEALIAGRTICQNRESKLLIHNKNGELIQVVSYRANDSLAFEEKIRSHPVNIKFDDEIIEGNKISLAAIEDKLEVLRVELNFKFAELSKETTDSKEVIDLLQKEVHENTYFNQANIPTNQLSNHQIIPVRLYLGSERGKELVEEGIRAFLNATGIQIIDEFEGEKGSWLRNWYARTFSKQTREELELELLKAKKAIELKTLGLPQSQVDSNNANAIATLLETIKDQNEAVLLVGSLLIIKYCEPSGNSKVFTKVLSQEEIIFLEMNQNLIQEPKEILNSLTKVSSSQLWDSQAFLGSKTKQLPHK
jgi:hypothetical protein